MSEYLEPQHDWVLMRQQADKEETYGDSPIIMPKGGDYENLRTDAAKRGYTPDREIEKNKRRNTNRYNVLAVGPGSYVDVADELHDAVFLRKPMCCAKGDVVIAQEGPVPTQVDGEILFMCHDYLILAIVRVGEDGKETLDPQHDYIFSKPAEVVQQTKSGLYMGVATDPTGNQSLPDRWTALGVGDGPWALRQEKGKIPAFARRPMSVKIGETFAFEGAGFWVTAMGAPMCVVQSYQVAGKFIQHDNV